MGKTTGRPVGRPPLPPDQKLRDETVRLAPADFEEADELAAASNRRRADIIRRAVKVGIEAVRAEVLASRYLWAEALLAQLPVPKGEPKRVQNAHGGGHHVPHWQLVMESGGLYDEVTRRTDPCQRRYRWPDLLTYAAKDMSLAQDPFTLRLLDGDGEVVTERVVRYGA
ncbi:MAG: hypothetical protein ACYC5O_12075 [Anaerolineae bacterium]